MSWNYKFIDHTADIAVDVEADSLAELFTASANAWRESITDDKSLIVNREKSLHLMEDTLEVLLVSFLSELNYLFQNNNWLMDSIRSSEVYKENNQWVLNAMITGNNFDREKINLKTEIKAVTYHQMNIKNVNEKYVTRIIFDI